MLARENRLRKTREFRKVAARSKGIRQNGLLLRVGLAQGDVLRVGIVVSKKVAKLATRRNRIRRVLREAVKRELASVKVRADIVFIVLPEFEFQDSRKVERTVHQLFQKASLLQ